MKYVVGSLQAFLAREAQIVLIEVAEALGSTPRETGAFMLVSPQDSHGTIGGGQMEHMAIDHARNLMAGMATDRRLDIPLGPEIGQCCGGRVALSFRVLDAAARDDLDAMLKARVSGFPEVWLFGAGHVGRALADALVLLPVRIFAVETRRNELDLMSSGASPRLTAMPEALVKDIAPGSAVIILTHDHALDFLIAREALSRADLAYTGMIGSKTKRATFASWARDEGLDAAAISRLVLPIGGKTVSDKRPAVIAAMTAAEVLTALDAYRRSATSFGS
ncbi:xanthine dehydrogenase accessory protein XdhC [Rhizobium sp. Leaf341]|uniref:xanthine dehydrogenase accessory protein XdhC n=1 Tax=Rhizobium sp. Leaf341 TaxID=1736344 RepID=UPI0007151A09|nr:xanthine dehydrogenase accessory protein XdhC [Rhizobium sp. Leaf341]KQR69162.1 xanthine dehydrogenase accessory protein XdhC [Rhizobium sp. Leaf341]